MSMLVPFGAQGKYLQRARTLVGMSPDFTQWYYDPMIARPGVNNPSWNANITAGNLISGIAVRGGVQRFLVNAGVGGVAEAVYDNSPAQLFDSFGNSRWYMGARVRMNSAVDAATYCYIGYVNDAFNQTIRLGVNGGASAANFSLAYGGIQAVTASVNLSAIDTNFHDFEMWCTANGSVNAAIDYGTPVTLAGIPVITGGRLFIESFNTLLAAGAREWDVDDACAVFESAP